jgi:hypothetical protein
MKVELLTTCDKCGNLVPDDCVYYRENVGRSYMKGVFPDEINRLCVICSNHRFCWPFYELAMINAPYNDVLTPEQKKDYKAYLEKQKHDCCLEDVIERERDYLKNAVKPRMY